ncbi:unnamed protein product [Cladocopium goreaui]|uniref:Retrovirus-related Pol polyprotein from transposon opus n=1 Tax=Cladocopium goreaui TaxID=2562237 RepID=A0A9P1G9Q1_9DINO|nr:unnamed protein product [Cladocopium goreaui]
MAASSVPLGSTSVPTYNPPRFATLTSTTLWERDEIRYGDEDVYALMNLREAEGVTLLDAIDAGRIPRPAEMTFPRWQAWRRGEGMRPTRRRDGRGLTTAEEVELWREVMRHLYGDDRADALGEEDEEGEMEGSPEGVLAIPHAVSPSPSEPPEGSPTPPVAGSAAASVTGLRAQIRALYDPEKEDLGDYLLRMGRIVTALQVLDAGCAPNTLDLITRKAEILIELYGEIGTMDRRRAVAVLRDKFTAYALDDKMSPREKDLSIGAVGEIIFSSWEGIQVRVLTRFSVLHPIPKEAEQRRMAPQVLLEEVTRSVESVSGLAAALEAQTKVLKEALAGRSRSTSSVTAVKTDLHWPTLGDDRSDFRDVTQFYQEFEVVNSPETVYERIKAKHLVFSESREEREIRIDSEHASLAKGLWGSEAVLSGPQTWEEAHKVVLEFEQREATNRATASAVYTLHGEGEDRPSGRPKHPKKVKKDAKEGHPFVKEA